MFELVVRDGETEPYTIQLNSESAGGLVTAQDLTGYTITAIRLTPSGGGADVVQSSGLTIASPATLGQVTWALTASTLTVGARYHARLEFLRASNIVLWPEGENFLVRVLGR